MASRMMFVPRVGLALVATFLLIAAPALAVVASLSSLSIEAAPVGSCSGGKTFCFNRDTLSGVNAGDSVSVGFNNPTQIPHSLCFGLPTGGVCTANATQGGMGWQNITFNAPAGGTYDYYCNVSGHREAGMFGKLTVQGAGTTPTPTPTSTPTATPTKGAPSIGLAIVVVGVGLLALALRRR